MSEYAYELSGVQKDYAGRRVVDILALTIKKGTIFGLVGPSGAGKSTLLRLLGLLEAPTSGQVDLYLGDQRLNFDTARIEDRRQLAMVFQRPALLSRTVRENVAYGLRLRGRRNDHVRVDAALDRVSLNELAGAHPRTLSGGELQRVALARALVLDPTILLLDEPTANLDPANVRLIEELILDQHSRSGATIALVTHNIFQARRVATDIGLLLNGELIEVAPADQFFEEPSDPRTEAFISGKFVY